MIKSIRNELAGVLLTFCVGILAGTFNLLDYDTDDTLTGEMKSRAEVSGLVAGAVVAAPSGIGVALSVANTNVNSLVGVAISAALLPPIVNSALLLVYGLYRTNVNDEKDNEYYVGSLISIGLFLMNWILIFVFSMITFHVKGLKGKELVQSKWSDASFHNHEAFNLAGNMQVPLLEGKENPDTKQRMPASEMGPRTPGEKRMINC
uniref:Uncharacterized protein n=1 Tax=Lotharella oceanica TaxID=641309 RepID=A0A7S2TU97_9EUKA|mmetsp:Transcript_30279/g.56558  ORF Transcript_30279/g.56558 Transcript_30279/m.56558 type:complete len:206 (+) Transcript_30279:3-620(+)